MALRKNDLEQLWQFMSLNLSDSIKNKILIPTGRGQRLASRDYIHANSILAEFAKQNPDFDKTKISSFEELMSKIDPATRFRLKYYTPCLAFRYDELKPAEQKALFEDKNWVATEKHDGCRGWIIFYKGKGYLFSRNYSDVDCGLPQYWGNIYQNVNIPADDIYAVDVEIKFEAGDTIQSELEEMGISTDSKLEAMSALLQMNQTDALQVQKSFKANKGYDLVVFRLIAPLYFKGKNYVSRTLGEGQDVYDEVIKYGNSLGLNIKPIKRCIGGRDEKELFLNNILDEGGEGVVFHNRLGKYCTSENRSKTSFVKLKRSVKATMAKQGVGDSIDGWVSGFKLGTKGSDNEGLVAAFEISIYQMDKTGQLTPKVIAYVPNIERKIMEMATEVVNGEPKMKKEFYGMVVEVDGQAISKVNHRLTHPRMLRYRNDKVPGDCIYSEDFILSQIV